MCPLIRGKITSLIGGHLFQTLVSMHTLEYYLDFSKLQMHLEEKLINDLTIFSKETKNENIYGLSLDCNIYESEISLNANTVDHLNKTVVNYSQEKCYIDANTDEIENDLRWATGDWKYMEIVFGYCDGQTWDEIHDIIDKNITNEFMEMLCKVAVSIEKNGLLNKLWPDRNVCFFCLEHDELAIDAHNRMNRIRNAF